MNVGPVGRFTFSGGVHPPENKGLTCDSQIQPGPAVKKVAVMLSQHIGAVHDAFDGLMEAATIGRKIVLKLNHHNGGLLRI